MSCERSSSWRGKGGKAARLTVGVKAKVKAKAKGKRTPAASFRDWKGAT